ncbi:helix-turn-helix domain-containing protein [Roseibium sediminicola]|uniref:AraC family transcriptional regulator n=1 Tax=Roseibium sediminicola TaxID=2933272 RepID=A0ABT0GU25_9HYPH|nr:AraC family transcriptional regulator [Roseibium sp. CAU 1639]MCK7612933.1 AraC family transcriptional regulator [Roseibium sp. CAU 1639]
MLFVPLPFVNALLLALVFVQLRRSSGLIATRPFLLLIALCCLQSVFIGLRWGYGIEPLRYAIPVLAALLPPVTLACFSGLAGDRHRGWYLHLVAPAAALAIAALLVLAPELVDTALIALFLASAFLLARLALAGPDGLRQARFDGSANAHRAIWLAAACLGFSACLDVLVLLDFERSGGVHAAALVSNANLVSLLLIGAAALAAGRAQTETFEDGPAAVPVPTPADADIVGRLDRLMTDQKLYRDDTLTLARLARRAGLPARQVSQAVNRVTGNNVSRFVNAYRIREVCELLADPDLTVLDAMYRAGFSTKSNFNREFLRVTGKTPDIWRKTTAGSR